MSPPAIPDFFEQPSQILFPNEEDDPSQARVIYYYLKIKIIHVLNDIIFLGG